MATEITDRMVVTTRQALNSLEGVRRARAILTEAGLTDVELRRVEIDAYRDYRERERLAREQAMKILSLGPLPEHRCILREPDPSAPVANAMACPYGCRPGQPRRSLDDA